MPITQTQKRNNRQNKSISISIDSAKLAYRLRSIRILHRSVDLQLLICCDAGDLWCWCCQVFTDLWHIWSKGHHWLIDWLGEKSVGLGWDPVTHSSSPLLSLPSCPYRPCSLHRHAPSSSDLDVPSLRFRTPCELSPTWRCASSLQWNLSHYTSSREHKEACELRHSSPYSAQKSDAQS